MIRNSKIKRCLCVFLCFIFVFLSFSVVYAKDSYLDWKQKDSRWGSIVIGNKTVASVGCTAVSMSILLVHSGLMDSKDFNPKVFVQDYKKAGGFNNNSFRWGTMDSYTNGHFKYVGDTDQKSDMDLSELKKLYEDGYFVTIYMWNNSHGSGTHWLACLDASSTDPKEIKIADPAYDSKTLADACKNSGNDGKHLRFVYYKCSKSKANEIGDKESSSSGGSSDNKNDSKDSNKQIETCTDGSNKVDLGNGKFGLVDPVSGELYELSEDSISLSDIEDLSQDQLKGVSDWKKNIDYINGGGFIKYLRIFVSFVGILFIVWMVLIYLSYWYDRINNFIDIEFLPIVTAGQLKVSPEEDNCTFKPQGLIRGSQQTVNHRAVLSICLIGISFSVFIITGKIYDVLAWFVVCIRKILNV